MKSKLLLTAFISLFITSCAGPSIFTSPGSKMANPLTLAVDSVNARLYVNNANNQVEYSDGSVHIVDISDPTNPIRITTDNGFTVFPGYSGELFFDSTNSVLYTPQRAAPGGDSLYGFNVDESSASFLDRSGYAANGTPFGVGYYATDNRLFVASEVGILDYYDIGNSMAHGTLDLLSTLDDGGVEYALGGDGAKRIIVFGTQALVTRIYGGVWVINLEEVGVDGKYPVDYFISDLALPRDGAYDSGDGYVYLADVEWPSGVETPSVYVLDLSALTPRTDNTTTLVVDKDDYGGSSLVVKQINLTTTDPQEIALTTNKVYVSSYVWNTVTSIDRSDADPANWAELTKITAGIGLAPFGLVSYPAGAETHVFVANNTSNTVSVIDVATDTVVGSYP